MKPFPKTYIYLLFLLWTFGANAQDMTFTLTTGEDALLPIPVKVLIDDISANNDSLLIKVYRDNKGKKILLKSQLQHGEQTALWIVPDETIAPGTKVSFIMELGNNESDNSENALVSMDRKNIHLMAGEQPVLDYRHAFQEAPDSADPIFGKSNLIFTLSQADGLLQIPSQITGLNAGDLAEVMLLF